MLNSFVFCKNITLSPPRAPSLPGEEMLAAIGKLFLSLSGNLVEPARLRYEYEKLLRVAKGKNPQEGTKNQELEKSESKFQCSKYLIRQKFCLLAKDGKKAGNLKSKKAKVIKSHCLCFSTWMSATVGKTVFSTKQEI